MIGSKEYFLIMTEDNFNSMSVENRALFSHVEVREANEWLENQDDPNYQKLYKAQKNAKKELQTYLFNKRNNKK